MIYHIRRTFDSIRLLYTSSFDTLYCVLFDPLKDLDGNLVSCEHGDRRVSVLTPGGGKRTLVDNYQGKRLNSPNDGVLKSNGDIYFTDPPYGLPMRELDPRRELDHEVIHLFGVLTSLFMTLDFRQLKGTLADPLDIQSCALDHDSTVEVTVPLKIQALSPSEQWILAGM